MSQVQFWALPKLKVAIALSNFLTVARKVLKLAAPLMLCLAMLIWSLPAQAASRLDPRLEQQVLQIIREHPEAILQSVEAYQQQQQQQLQKAQQGFLQQLRTDPKAIIGNSPTTGAEASKIVLVEFSDFECPYCAEAQKTLKQFITKHREVLLVYKHFPLTSIHPEAMPAAKAAWAAGLQGKFWEYQDALFTQQDKLGESFYMATAENLNLDLERFNSDRNAATVAIGQDMQLAQSLGLSGTPFFVMSATGASEGQAEIFTGAVQLSDLESILARVSKS